MLDDTTRETLHEAIGQRTLGERLDGLVECTVETRQSLGTEGLVAVTATRVVFASHDSLHGTQVTVWDRGALEGVVLETDLFGPKLTLTTADHGEIRIHRFADEGASAHLLELLDGSPDVPLTMEPQPAVPQFFDSDPAVIEPTPTTAAAGRARPVLVLAGAVSVLLIGVTSAAVFFLLQTSPSPRPVPPQAVEPIAPTGDVLPEPVGQTTIDMEAVEASETGYGLDPDTIDRVMQRGSLGRCFADADQRGTPYRGSLTLVLVIDPAGTISATSIDDAASVDDTLAGCVTSRVARLRFPSFDGSYPQIVRWQLQVE